jgi:hypothetical protein
MLLLHPPAELPRSTRWLLAGLGQRQQQLALQQAPAGMADWSPSQIGLYPMAVGDSTGNGGSGGGEGPLRLTQEWTPHLCWCCTEGSTTRCGRPKCGKQARLQ